MTDDNNIEHDDWRSIVTLAYKDSALALSTSIQIPYLDYIMRAQ